MDTTRKLDFDGRKIWIRKFGEGKTLLITDDNRFKGMMVKIMQEKHDGSIETLLPLDELSTEDLQGIAHFVVDPERVQLLIDLTTISLGVMTMTPEEDGEPNE